MTPPACFPIRATTVQDNDRLIHLSEAVGQALPENSLLDGHDFGLGEFNIFIHAREPEALFEGCEVLAEAQPGLAFTAGYRAFEDQKCTVLWPPSATEFPVA